MWTLRTLGRGVSPSQRCPSRREAAIAQGEKFTIAMRGHVYMWEDRVLYVGPDLPSTLHAHHAVQVCISLSEPLRFRSSLREPWRGHGGAVIPSDVPHQTDPVVPLLATFWLDAETPEARRLVERRIGGAILPIESSRVRVLVARFRACWEDTYNGSEAARLLDEAIGILAPCAEPSPSLPLDPRVVRARELLRLAPMRRLALPDLAAAVSLSPGR